MSTGPMEMNLAASFDWETLIPVLFFVLYGIAQLLGSKKKGGATEDEVEVEEVDMEERARQIREEIRRKIEERKQARENRTPQEAPAQRRSLYDPTVPEGGQGRSSGRMSQPQYQRPVQQPEPAATRQAQGSPAMSQQSSLERRLQEQRAILEKARREQKAAKEKARAMMKASGVDLDRKRREAAVGVESGNLREQLLRGLRDPVSIRQAVLYREILDPPLGLR